MWELSAGVLEVLALRDRPAFSKYMDEIGRDRSIATHLPAITAIVRPTDSDIERLLVAVQSGFVEASTLGNLGYGRALENCSTETVHKLLDVMLDAGANQAAFLSQICKPSRQRIDLRNLPDSWNGL